MNEPRRWLEEPDISHSVRELLRAAPPPRALDERTRARSRGRLLALAALPSAAGAFFWLPHVALGALLGTLGVATLSAVKPDAPAAPRAESAARPAPRAHVTRATEKRYVAVPVASNEAAPPSRAKSTQPLTPTPSTATAEPAQPSPAQSLAEEARLLESARRSVDVDPARALALLSDHERRFSAGGLALEREFLRVSALVRLGRRAEAHARAAELRRRGTTSLYEQRLKDLLGEPL